MTFIIYFHEDARAAARLALDAKLFVPNWCLKDELEMVRNSDRDCSETIITLAFNNQSKPIGICLFEYNQLSVFVKPKFRHLGVGSKLISLIKPHVDSSKLFGCHAASGLNLFI